MQTVSIRHNCEMGHRLSLQPDSKCYHLHGHSWWIEVEIQGPPDPMSGMIVNFSEMKGKIRSWLDLFYDHHMLLNPNDPLVLLLHYNEEEPARHTLDSWGITVMPEEKDPTVENFAQLIYRQCSVFWTERYWKFRVTVQESHTNKAVYGDW